MIKVITYGTYDLLHRGHIRLLERAKELGDYLIVGVTADDFDKIRGKINVQQSLIERIEAVRATGIADEIIVEEYEGQKIDDIRRYGIDIFTVGTDWIGKFDYLNEYCKVIYLERTEGISSSDVRTSNRKLKIGLVGDSPVLKKFFDESKLVNGVYVNSIYTEQIENLPYDLEKLPLVTNNYDTLLESVDALYIISHPKKHFEQIKCALSKGKHIICESPIAMDRKECEYLFELANKNHCVLFDGIKTAYSTAYYRLILLVKSGKIGEVVSVDATCTSLNKDYINESNISKQTWNSICAWGPTALLPIFQILGTNYISNQIISKIINDEYNYDAFTKINLNYPNATASIKVGKGVKSEGELIISGTKAYIYVPAPWWKTDYFEIRYENPVDNKRYFYQLDGEGMRYEIIAFAKAIESIQRSPYISEDVSESIAHIISNFENKDIIKI